MDSGPLKTWCKRFGPKTSSELELLRHIWIGRSLVKALNASGIAPDGNNFCDTPKSVAEVIVHFIEASCIFDLKICGNRSNIVVWETVVSDLEKCTAYGTYSRFLTPVTFCDFKRQNVKSYQKQEQITLLIYSSLSTSQITSQLHVLRLRSHLGALLLFK